MFVDQIEILNLFDKEKITIPFKKKITFLTGNNGSGKSSLLNVIFDSLICDPKKFSKPSTSKNRFWASRVSFSNKVVLESLVLPNPGKEFQSDSKVSQLIKEDFFDIESIQLIQEEFDNSSDTNSLTYVNLDSSTKGELWCKKWDIPTTDSTDEAIENMPNSAPLGFIFQEDRNTLHNMDNSNLDRTTPYWGLYKNSIDERFSYCRDAVQIRESHLNKQLVKEVSKYTQDGDFKINDLLGSETFMDISSSQAEIEEMIDMLNKYFSDSDKCVVRDADNKITLGQIASGEDDPKPISWNLLSRGEKTLLYLFFAIYYYKDRISVFLLDEPEISFHVTWQEKLIKDLSSIAPNNQFIIATHSPSLVMDGWMPNCLDLTA